MLTSQLQSSNAQNQRLSDANKRLTVETEELRASLAQCAALQTIQVAAVCLFCRALNEANRAKSELATTLRDNAALKKQMIEKDAQIERHRAEVAAAQREMAIAKDQAARCDICR